MLVFFKKIFIIFLVALVLILCIPLMPILFVLRIIYKPWSIEVSTIVSFVIWSLLGVSFRQSFKTKGPNVLSKNTNYLIISNHVGAFDFMVVNEIFRETGMMRHIKYVVKESLMFFPIFYQMVRFLNFLILKRNFFIDKKRIIRYIDIMKKYSIPSCIVLFPEGSRFTIKKRDECLEHSKKVNSIEFTNTLYPRYKGLELIGGELRNSYIKYVADITIMYKDNAVPSLFKVLFCDFKTEIYYDIKITPIEEITSFKQFLLDSFERKDKLIGDLQKNKNF